MTLLLGTPVLMGLAILQSTVMRSVTLLDGAPDLVLLAVIAWAITGRSGEALGLAMVGGLALDLLSGLPLGLTSLSLLIVTLLVSLLGARFWEAHVLMPLGVTVVGSIVYHVLGIGAVLLFGREVDLALALARIVMPSTFLNLLLALPVVQLAGSIRQSLYPPEVGI